MSFDRWGARGTAHPIGAESEVVRGRIRAQLGNGDTPSMRIEVVVKTQDGVPSCMNAVYHADTLIIQLHYLLRLNDASNMIDEED